MPKIVFLKLLIDVSEFLTNYSRHVMITQGACDHGHFQVSFPTNATEGYDSALMDNSSVVFPIFRDTSTLFQT